MHNARAVAEKIVLRRNRTEKKSAELNPCPILSAVTGDCIQQGKDVFAGGARYSAGSLGLTGLGTLIDSLIAVREIVYNEKQMTLEEFVSVLRDNFRGHEPLRQYILNRLPKHGSEDTSTLELSGRVFADMAQATSGFPNGRGGKYEASLFSHTNYMRLGTCCEATPDGRLKGENMSKGIGPSFISLGEKWAAGQILDSIQEIDLTDYPVIGILDLKIPPVSPEQSEVLIIPILERFIENGGSVLQINCIDTDDLKQAQKNPEKFPNLVVRVSGFSASFVTLGKGVQDEVIRRSECCI
jgi:formate C-acetyltransferase